MQLTFLLVERTQLHLWMYVDEENVHLNFYIENVFWQFTIPKPQPFYHCDSFVVYRQQDIKNIKRYI